MSVGWGFDAHAFGGDRPVVLGGVSIDTDLRVAATSDGDVVAHAITDALLGAAALGDLGSFYPSSEARWEGVASVAVILRDAAARVRASGWDIEHIDVTVIAESIRVAPHRAAIRAHLAEALGVAERAMSVKATTTDGLGFIGRDEGLAAVAVAVLVAQPDGTMA